MNELWPQAEANDMELAATTRGLVAPSRGPRRSPAQRVRWGEGAAAERARPAQRAGRGIRSLRRRRRRFGGFPTKKANFFKITA